MKRKWINNRKLEHMPNIKAEEILDKMNLSMVQLETKLTQKIKRKNHPIVFICVAPRCGSTVLAQLMAKTGCFNYITNVMARFWRAPYIGGVIQNETGLIQDNSLVSLKNDFGMTTTPMDPHEFFFFWEKWLPNSNSHTLTSAQLKRVDKKGLKKEINAILSLSDKPLFLKSGIACMNIKFIHQLFPNSYFVVIKRDYRYIAQSIYKCRKRRYENVDQWWSIQPPNYKELIKHDPYTQIAGQIIETYKEMDRQLKSVSNKRIVRIQFEDLAKNPSLEIKKIFQTIKLRPGAGWDQFLPRKLVLNNKRYLPKREFDRLTKALENYPTQS